jgi:hypothetical protein
LVENLDPDALSTVENLDPDALSIDPPAMTAEQAGSYKGEGLRPFPNPLFVNPEAVKARQKLGYGSGDMFVRNMAAELASQKAPSLERLVPGFEQRVGYKPTEDSQDPERYKPRFSLEDFLQGTHSLGDIPGLEYTEGVPFSHEDIVTRFSNLRKGDLYPDDAPLAEQAVRATGEFVRGAIPSATGLATGFRLAPLGAAAGFATLGPPGSIIGGASAFFGGTFLGEKAADILMDEIVGKQSVKIPGTDRSRKALSATGAALPYAGVPWLLKNAHLNAAKYLEANLTARFGPSRLSPVKYEGGVSSSATPVRGAINRPKTVRDPKTGMVVPVKGNRRTRLVMAIEQAMGRQYRDAKNHPYLTGIVEAAAVGGTGVAVFATDPENAGQRFAAELIGGVAPSTALQALLNGPTASVLKGVYKGFGEGYRETGQTEAGFLKRFWGGTKGTTSGFSARRNEKAAEAIRGWLENEGGLTPNQVDELADALAVPYADLDPSLKDLNLKLTAGQITGNPILNALEATVNTRLGGLSSAQQKEAARAEAALRGVLYNLMERGDPDSVKLAADITEGAFNQQMHDALTKSMDQWLEAYTAVRGEEGLNMTVLGDKLHTIFTQNLARARQQETKLYNNIPETDFLRFYDDEGNVVDRPQVLSYFEENVENGVIAAYAREDVSELGSTAQALDEIRTQLGLGGPPLSPDLPELKVFNNAVAGYAGEEGSGGVLGVFNKVLNGEFIGTRSPDGLPLLVKEDGKLVPSQANIEALGDIITRREKGGEKPQQQKVTALLRKQKNLLTALTEVPANPAGQAAGPLTLKQLVQIRSKALALARKQGAVTGHEGIARLASDLAAAARKDIENYGKYAGDEMSKEAVAAWVAATSHSKALNDVFSRGFVDNALSRSKTGAYEILPENLAVKLKGDADVTAPRYAQIKQVDDYMENELGMTPYKGVPDADGVYPELGENEYHSTAGTLDKVLRHIFTRATDPDTGLLNPSMLRKTVANMSGEGRPLEYFPELRRDLDNLDTATALFEQTQTGISDLQKQHKSQSLFSKLYDPLNPTESVPSLIGSALGGRSPMLHMEQLVKPLQDETVPKALRTEAKEGFVSGLLEHVIGHRAGLEAGEGFNPIEAYKQLFVPLKKAGSFTPSLRNPRDFDAAAKERFTVMGFLTDKGVIDPGEAVRMERLLREMVRFKTYTAAGDIGALTEGSGPMLDFYLRITGSALGAAAQKTLPISGQTGSIVASSAGSRLMRQMFDEMPQISAMQTMRKMMEDPVLLSAMLKQPKTERAALDLFESVKRILVKQGIVTPVRRAVSAAVGTEDQEAPAPAPAPAPQQKAPGDGASLYGQRFSRKENQPVAQAPKPEPFLGQIAQAAQPAQAPANAPRPAGPVNSETVKKMAALFPEGGIASMMS